MRKLTLVVLISSIDPAAAAEAIDQPPPPRILPPAAQRDLVIRVCSACHAPEMITVKRHTSDEWDDIIAKMVDHGARANDVEQEQILAYLVRFYGKPASQQ